MVDIQQGALGPFKQNVVTRQAVLVQYFGVPYRALDTIGYGEDHLLVPTPNAEWRNRRVTLRRVTDFVTMH